MLRSLPRAGPSSLYLRPHLRTNPRTSKVPKPVCTAIAQQQQQQSRQASSQHAISNPTLAGIEKRWELMQPQEQADLWMALRDRMKTDWHELTMQEKKAGEPYQNSLFSLKSKQRKRASTLAQAPRLGLWPEANSHGATHTFFSSSKMWK